jgi:hypothetical protein
MGGLRTAWNSARQDGSSRPARSTMKLILQTAIVFFGTLLAAALVALGEPATAEVSMVQATPTADTVLVSLLGADEAR